MKKLKCWKKIRNNVWKKDRESILEIRYDGILKGYDIVLAKGLAPSQQKFLNKKTRKTKSQALSFAEKYMEGHDTC